jgi:hypothetical protein
MPVKRRAAKARSLRIDSAAGEQFRKVIALQVAARDAEDAAHDAERELERMCGFQRKPWDMEPIWQEYQPGIATAGKEDKRAAEVEAYETFLALLKAAGWSQSKYSAQRYHGGEEI